MVESKAGRHVQLDTILLISALLVIVASLLVLFVSVTMQMLVYHHAIDVALSNSNFAASLAFARSADFAVAKFSGLFLGFVLIFLGSAFTLRAATQAYQIQLSEPGSSAPAVSLETSSPGLILATLGLILVVVVVVTQSSVNLNFVSPPVETEPMVLEVVEDSSD